MTDVSIPAPFKLFVSIAFAAVGVEILTMLDFVLRV